MDSGSFFQSETAPAWVQAVGSILAIVFAGVVVVWQHRLDREADRERAQEQRKASLLAAQALVAGIRERVELLGTLLVDLDPKDHARTAGMMASFAREMEALSDLVSRFDLTCFTEPEQFKRWPALIASLRGLGSHFRSWEANAERAFTLKADLPEDIVLNMSKRMETLEVRCGALEEILAASAAGVDAAS